MFKSEVKQSPSQSPDVLLGLTRGCDVSHSANAVSARYRTFSLPHYI